MKNVYRVSTKQHGAEVKCLLSQKLDHLARSVCWCTLLLQHKSNYSHRHVSAITLRIFCGCNCKTSRICHSQIKLSSPLEQGSNWHTSWDRQACTYGTLWRQCYVTTSKKYLINCHILLKYFECVFFQLQLVKILCKLIVVWVSYERKKRGSIFYETPCSHRQEDWVGHEIAKKKL